MKRIISILVGAMIVGLIPCSPVFALEHNSWTAESRIVVIEVEKGELITAAEDFTSDLGESPEEYPEHEELTITEGESETPYELEDPSPVAEEVDEIIYAEPDRDVHITTDEEDSEEQIETKKTEIETVIAVSEPIELPAGTSEPEEAGDHTDPVEIGEDGSLEEGRLEGKDDPVIIEVGEDDDLVTTVETMTTGEPGKNEAEDPENHETLMPTEDSISLDDDQEDIEKTGSTEGEE